MSVLNEELEKRHQQQVTESLRLEKEKLDLLIYQKQQQDEWEKVEREIARKEAIQKAEVLAAEICREVVDKNEGQAEILDSQEKHLKSYGKDLLTIHLILN